MIAPGEEVGVCTTEPPTRSETQALAAARFAIEDDLAQPLEEVEILLADRRRQEVDRQREVAVVARDRLAAWRAGLEAIGVAPDFVTPDYAALPTAPGEILVVDLGERVLARGKGVGLAIEARLAPAVLGAALARRPEDTVRLLSERPDEILPPVLREGRRVDLAPAADEAALLAMFEEGLADGPSIDLARLWRARPSFGSLGLGRWRTAAGLAAAAGIASLALLGGETLALRGHAAAAEGESERILLAAFPDMGRVVNPRAQLRERVGAAGAGGKASFLELSAILSESLAGVDAMQLESVRFDADEGRLEAALAYASYADVEQLRAGIEARGGRLAEGASRMRGDRMTGDVVVTGP
jgi:general secretion pathway protein L